ncbi:hypothetical protein [Paraburkholderia saeva]|uniref:Uncharacterized protein n=1 Tax=Paraburkholderia saeva TaxID=2777537 RepID=A0A9N8X214_9BURK|nr:hypothetical protein [Paraburkholderia saeva]CAG4900646.1 hypothetical protein LMG31841_02901 [Paraburkholderia saeva]
MRALLDAPNRHYARDVRYVTIEPGHISLHGVALTDDEYRTLRVIAERMKQQQVAEVVTC